MNVVTLEARSGLTFHATGDARYFLLNWQGAFYAVPDACPHRGGPLSKGQVNTCKGFIICPMHQLRTQVRVLLAKALPALRVGERMTVVF